MVATDKLRGIIAEKNMSQRQIAKAIGMTEKTFYNKMKTGKFNSDEMEKIARLLNITNLIDIFFAGLGA